jgi:hypothetical protein
MMIDLCRWRGIEAAYLDAFSLLPEAQVPSEETRARELEALAGCLNTAFGKMRC